MAFRFGKKPVVLARGANVWEVYEARGSEERQALSQRERDVFAICDFRQEVNSGGFDGYLRSWGGDTALEAVAALPTLLGEPWAQVLRDALDIFGSPYPADCDTREAIIDNADPLVLSGLFDRFLALESDTDADAILTAALAAT